MLSLLTLFLIFCILNKIIFGGIKLSASDSDSDVVSKWRGQNLLGKCIGNVHKWLLTED